jgi:hypothetical protein
MNKIEHIEVASELYRAGRSDDGTDYTAEVYLVTVEFQGGEVYAHNVSFPGCKVEQDEEGYSHFGDIRPEAEARANSLCARVQAHVAAGGTLDMAQWSFWRTVYGSGAYLSEVAGMTPRQRAGEED